MSAMILGSEQNAHCPSLSSLRFLVQAPTPSHDQQQQTYGEADVNDASRADDVPNAGEGDKYDANGDGKATW